MFGVQLLRLRASWRRYDFPRWAPDAPKPPEANLLARLYFNGVERGDADAVATGVRRVTGHDVPEMGHPIDALCIEIQEP